MCGADARVAHKHAAQLPAAPAKKPRTAAASAAAPLVAVGVVEPAAAGGTTSAVAESSECACTATRTIRSAVRRHNRAPGGARTKPTQTRAHKHTDPCVQ